MSFTERLHSAHRAQDLSTGSHGTTQVDFLAASAISERGNLIGSLAFRAVESDHDTHRLHSMFSKTIIARARAKFWHIKKREDLEAFTLMVINYWLNPQCQHCSGRGALTQGQILKNECEACLGSGRRSYPTPLDIGLDGIVREDKFCSYVKFALNCLDARSWSYVYKTRKTLGR
jgi:hypothetical protein